MRDRKDQTRREWETAVVRNGEWVRQLPERWGDVVPVLVVVLLLGKLLGHSIVNH